MKSKRLGTGKYEVEQNGKKYRVIYNAGMWDVKAQEVKGCDYFFTVDCVPLRKNAFRLIGDGQYERQPQRQL